MKEKKGKIITICSMKGGVGKSITTCLLGKALAREKKRVLLLDLDLFTGCLDFLFGIDCRENIVSLQEAYQTHQNFQIESYTTSISDSLDLVASPKNLQEARKIESKMIPKILSSFQSIYDYILVDTNTILGEIGIRLLDFSDQILMLFSQSATSIKNTKNFHLLLKDVPKENILFLFNRSLGEEETFTKQDCEAILEQKVEMFLTKDFFIPHLQKVILENQFDQVLMKLIEKNSFPLQKIIKKEGDQND